MSSNQTIDGVLVSRELLEVFAGPRNNTPEQMRKAMDELRALLDAKTCGLRGKPTVCGKATCEDCAYEMPAAQPQGEPVAWMYRREGGECLGQLVQMESDSLKDVREGKVVEGYRILWPRDDYIDWKPLYAEQPAPVAVVLPDRKEPDLEGFDDDHYAYGWNACLDELKRLNPSL